VNAANTRDFKTLDASIDDAASAALLGRYKAAVARFTATSATAVRRSRAETVSGAGDRDGSRTYFQTTVLPAESAATKAGEALRAEVTRNVGQAKGRTDASAASGRTTIIVAAVLATLAAFGLAFLVVVSVVRPLKVVVERLAMLRDVCITGLSDAIKAMASGDLTKMVEPKTPQIENPAADEVGDVARAFNDIQAKMVESIDGYNETRAQLGGPVRITRAGPPSDGARSTDLDRPPGALNLALLRSITGATNDRHALPAPPEPAAFPGGSECLVSTTCDWRTASVSRSAR
jgi:methyl-accepting chemotaxis protein